MKSSMQSTNMQPEYSIGASGAEKGKSSAAAPALDFFDLALDGDVVVRTRLSNMPLLLLDVGATLLGLHRAEDDVHFLERAALCLRDEPRAQLISTTVWRASNRDGSQAEYGHAADVDGGEHEEELVAQGGLHVRRPLRDDEVEEPLRGARGREAVVARARREDVRDVHPRQRAPAHRVEAHVDVEHRGHRLARRWGLEACGRRRGRRERLEQRADNEEEDAHAHRGDEQRELAAEGLDEEEDEDGRRDEFDDAVDPGREERVGRARVSNLEQGSYLGQWHVRGTTKCRCNVQIGRSGAHSSSRCSDRTIAGRGRSQWR